MRILILGASQGTGALAVGRALEQGHEVTALARRPERLSLNHAKLNKVAGDFHDRASIDGVMAGQNAVIITASAASLRAFKENPNYFSLGTRHAIDSMKAHDVRRLAVLSALGTGPSLKLLNFLVRKLVAGILLKVPFEDHERQERMVMDSGLDWVIARPGRLTNGPAQHRYIKTAAIEPVPSSISRADVADFLVQAVESETWFGKAVQIGG